MLPYKSSYRKHVNEWMWLCSTETLFTKAGRKLDLIHCSLLTPSLAGASDESGVFKDGCRCASHAGVVQTPWLQPKAKREQKLLREGAPTTE